jgi:hypothetical protein
MPLYDTILCCETLFEDILLEGILFCCEVMLEDMPLEAILLWYETLFEDMALERLYCAVKWCWKIPIGGHIILM